MLDLDISITFQHRIRFTKGVFALDNTVLRDLFPSDTKAQVIVFIENEIVAHLDPILVFSHSSTTYVGEYYQSRGRRVLQALGSGLQRGDGCD